MADGGDLDEARTALVQALGRQSQFWGLGKMAGEMYAVLYLSGEPLPLEEVARQVQVTKGNVSIALHQLEHLGMVRRSWKPGDRRLFLEAESDFWKIGHSVLGLRQKPEFDQSFALVDEAVRAARGAEASPERDRVIERLIALHEFYRILDSVVELALSLSPGQLKVMAKGVKALAARMGHSAQ